MRKRILTIIIIGALVYGFFAAGGNIQIENGIPVVAFNGFWEDVGASIGNAVGDLVDGFVDEFTTCDTVSGISSVISSDVPTE